MCAVGLCSTCVRANKTADGKLDIAQHNTYGLHSGCLDSSCTPVMEETFAFSDTYD